MKPAIPALSDAGTRPGKAPNLLSLLWERRDYLPVIVLSVLIFFGCIVSPPSLVDDVDAVQAQVARNMVESGDWVTPELDGVPYMEKAPLRFWMLAVSFLIFGVHDWAARMPIALSAVLLCWVVARFGRWAFGRREGTYAGMVLATSIGLFLFTRILIPDVTLTLAITVAIYSLARLLEEEHRSWFHPMAFWAAMAAGVLLKGLIGVVFPAGVAVVYLLLTRRFFLRETWRRFRPLYGVALFLAIAAPWHVLAMVRNPPLFDFTMHAEPGSYRGFFWFYFINEQVLRFLNLRYPRDYDTVPRLYFWLLHLVWLFPWSFYAPAAFRLKYGRTSRAARARLLALCWIGFVMIFFTLSTTQEYYSLPCYPALALVLGSALASGRRSLAWSSRAVAVASALCFAAVVTVLVLVGNTPAPGDISSALTEHPEAYTLSLGHLQDLTLGAFAYLRRPLMMAAAAFAIGAAGAWFGSNRKAYVSLAVMMLFFFHAAHSAMAVFDPYLSSRPLARILADSPDGLLIVDSPYWEFSSLFFYSEKSGLMLNGRRNNLEYGSYAPGAADVFIGDEQFLRLWRGNGRCYVATFGEQADRLESLVGKDAMHLVKAAGGKRLYSNRKMTDAFK